MTLDNVDLQEITTLATELSMEYSPKILGAIAVWIIGSWIIKVIKNVLRKTLNKGDYDESLKKFIEFTIISGFEVAF